MLSVAKLMGIRSLGEVEKLAINKKKQGELVMFKGMGRILVLKLVCTENGVLSYIKKR